MVYSIEVPVTICVDDDEEEKEESTNGRKFSKNESPEEPSTMDTNLLQLPSTPKRIAETPRIRRNVSFNIDDVEAGTSKVDADATPILYPILNEHDYLQHTIETLDGYFKCAPSPPRKMLHSRRPSAFQTVSIKHGHWGIRHIVLVGILCIYACVGGAMFLALEAENEKTTLMQKKVLLDEFLTNMASEIVEVVNVTAAAAGTSVDLQSSVEMSVRRYYRMMLLPNSKYHNSILHMAADDSLTGVWNYESAVFYSMTVFTTIGYGAITCKTVAGKAVTIIYAIIGIPLMLVVLSDVGRVLLAVLTRSYNRFRFYYLRLKAKWKLRKGIEATIIRKKDYKAAPFPFYLTIVVVVMYLLLCAVIVEVFDWENGSYDGMSYGNAVYFSFISMSTIGFGDVMPANVMYSPIIQLMFLFGLALISVINSTLYESCEKRFMKFVYRIEKAIARIPIRKMTPDKTAHKGYNTQGYNVFKNLSHNIKLLAIAVPMFDENEEEMIGDMLEPQAVKLPHALAILSESIAEIRPGAMFRAMRSNSKLSERGLGLKPEVKKKRSQTVTAVPLNYHDSLEKADSLDEHRKDRCATVSVLDVPLMPFSYFNWGFESEIGESKTGKRKKAEKKKSSEDYSLAKVVIKPRTYSDIA